MKTANRACRSSGSILHLTFTTKLSERAASSGNGLRYHRLMNSAQSSAVSPQSLISALMAALLILFSTLAVFQPPTRHYASMIIEAPEKLSITFLLNGRERAEDCEATIANLASAILASCPTCRIKQLQCLTELDSTQQRLLSSEPLDAPSARLPSGVATYAAPNPAIALATCQESQRLAAESTAPMTCFPADTGRPLAEPARKVTVAQALWAVFALIAAGLGAWFTCWLILRYEHLHSHLSHDLVASGPQKFHSVPTPRIGGIALMAGLLAGGGVLLALQAQFKLNTADFGYLLIAGAPAFWGGIAEDVTKKGNILHRLLLTMLAGSLGAWLLGAILNRVDIPGIDAALLWLPFAVALTVFAVGGVANALNIIDGYNGLAGGFAVIVLAAMAWVAAQVGDGFIFTTALILIGALLGFLAWNWPKGRIFLGDGGAYLLGFVLAELSVLLVVRNPLVSPWFPMALLSYPIIETFYSVYRRTFLRGYSPGRPDALHLHHLIYKRVIRRHVGSKDPQFLTERNSRVAPYVLCTQLAYAGFAVVFWQVTPMLMAAVGAGSLLYIYLYRRITTWSVPKWLLTTKRN
jgi:UDP-GlcNAc:undecaprenyl-phosphate/decaprenyl-phosphate GlcNAc-1-phosphate transferase